eukprot:gene27-193_t
MGSVEEATAKNAINVNVGIIGHIDSGKTSLSKVLSEVASTASMDKAPASQARGITLDLGFSSFSRPAPEHFKEKGYDFVQMCLVDCPGHASLIRTIIGGAQIMDMCCLIVDINKGMQTQTAECLVLAEILAQRLVVVLNKVDMIPVEQRAKKIALVTNKLRKVFASTCFGEKIEIVATSAAPDSEPIGVQNLLDTLLAVKVPKRDSSGPFFFAFDHCFSVKGQGTIITGTLLSGSVKPGDVIENPCASAVKHKVKSLQMFQKPVKLAKQGERVALCVPGLDTTNLERGVLTDGKVPMPTMSSAICVCRKIKYFKSQVLSKAKFHVSIGHTTVMGKLQFFKLAKGVPTPQKAIEKSSSDEKPDENDNAENELVDKVRSLGVGGLLKTVQEKWPEKFDNCALYDHLEEMVGEGEENFDEQTFCLMEFEKPVTVPIGSMVIGSKLDFEIHSPSCRMAFFGKLLSPGPVTAEEFSGLRIMKQKERSGLMDRVEKNDKRIVICKNLVKKETDISLFLDLEVVHRRSGMRGKISGSFGKSGKVKVTFDDDVAVDTDEKGNVKGNEEIVLFYRKYIYDKSSRFAQ